MRGIAVPEPPRQAIPSIRLVGLALACALLEIAIISGAPAAAQTNKDAAGGFDSLAARAAAARDAERLEEAAALYRQALKIRPSWEEGWWYLGTLLYDRDDFSAAASAFERQISLKPRSGDPLVMLGLCEAKLGRGTEALRHFERGQRRGMAHVADLKKVMLFTQGALLLESGEFGKAQEALDALARDGANQDELFDSLGLSVLGMKPSSLASADAEVREIVRRAGQAEHHAARSEVPDAFEGYTKLAADAPRVHNVQFALGRFLLANHEDDKAVEAFKREIENTPNHLLARLGIAGTLTATDPRAALPYAEQAVKLAPELAEAHFLLGSIFLGLGESRRAVAELEFAQRKEPNQAKIYFPLSKAYAAVGRNQDAARARKTFARLNAGAASATQH